MIGNIIGWTLFGLVVGAVAKFFLPGRVPMGCLATIVLGVAGSLVGGLVCLLLFGGSSDSFEPAGFVGAVLGGIVVLLILRRSGNTA